MGINFGEFPVSIVHTDVGQDNCKEYRFDSKCVKCGFTDAISLWVAKGAARSFVVLNGEFTWVASEYMQRTCRTCGFMWAELPLDSVKPNE